MLKSRLLLPAALLIAGMTSESAHEVAWPHGMSRQMGEGTCAKGPCMKCTSVEKNVPHRHVGEGKCIGKGAVGSTAGHRFDYSAR